MRAMRIVIADDHSLVRVGVRTLLEQLHGVEVVGEASDGREALEAIKKHRPDIALLDIGMAGMNGLETTARVTKDYPNVRVIILSMHATEEYVWQALRAGAKGYLLKDSGLSELELAIKAVSNGEMFLTPAVSKKVVLDYMQRMDTETTPVERLTRRQREVLQLIAEGNTVKEIAYQLNLSVKTVETHRSQLMGRLDIHDVPGLVRYAMRMGIIDKDM
ncbi:MAG: response regulator transcription factor [Candidatus Latescibacteria bacterium]|jgi:DNA-binding NarL/FixJ family response regulator|nr:response regulator transcription factor [Candidatus Latescibacterota bacterium]